MAEYISMDKAVYDYFSTLDGVVARQDGNGGEPAEPANPNSNWSNDALGYFGAFSVDTDTLIVGARGVSVRNNPVRLLSRRN